MLAALGSLRAHQRFAATVYLLSEADGGRRTTVRSGYCPQFYVRTTGVSGVLDSRVPHPPKPCISAGQCRCQWIPPAADASVDGQDRPGRHDGAVTAADKRVDLQVRGVEEERAVDASGFVGLGQDGCAEVPASAAGAIEERDCSHRECGPGLLRADGHLYPRCTYLLV